jgi:hypothetical protein
MDYAPSSPLPSALASRSLVDKKVSRNWAVLRRHSNAGGERTNVNVDKKVLYQGLLEKPQIDSGTSEPSGLIPSNLAQALSCSAGEVVGAPRPSLSELRPYSFAKHLSALQKRFHLHDPVKALQHSKVRLELLRYDPVRVMDQTEYAARYPMYHLTELDYATYCERWHTYQDTLRREHQRCQLGASRSIFSPSVVATNTIVLS